MWDARAGAIVPQRPPRKERRVLRMKVQSRAAEPVTTPGHSKDLPPQQRVDAKAPAAMRPAVTATDISNVVNPHMPEPLVGYAFALLAVGAAGGLSAAIRHTGNETLLLLLLAVVATTWFAGMRPALLAVASSIPAAAYFLFDPVYSPGVSDSGDAIGLAIFVFVAFAFVLVYGRTRAAVTTIDQLNTNLALLYHDERLARDRAEVAMDRLRQVETITDTALGYLELDALLAELLGRLKVALHADTTVVLLTDDRAESLRVRASSGQFDETSDTMPVPFGAGLSGRIAATRKPLVVDDLSSIEPVIPLLRNSMKSAMGVPLLRGGRLVGVLFVATVARREFQGDDLALLELVAERMSAAIDRAQLYEQARAIADDLQQANELKEYALARHRAVEDQLTSLIEASGGLIASLELEKMLPGILQLSRRLISADGYALWGFNPETERWAILSSDGLSDSYLAQASMDAAVSTPQLDDVMIVPDVDADPALRDRLFAEGIKSLLGSPLNIAGEAHGALMFYYRTRHEFDPLEVRVGSALSNLVASALTTARLEEEQRRSAIQLSRANLKLRFLTEASAILADSLDYETTLQSVAQLAVPEIADWCAVNLLDDDGQMRTLSVAHVDPEKVEFVRTLESRYPADPDAAHGWPEVLRTGRSELINEIPDELLVEGAGDEGHLRVARAMGLTSSLCVPLIARGPVLGTITFVRAGNSRRLTESDVPLAEELARRAAVAIDNAQLFRATERTAADLRRANEAKDEFLGLVSHELRTPITTIMGNAEVLERRGDKIDAASRRGALADISAESLRLHRLIENMLVLARLEQGHTIELEPVLLQRHLAHVVQMQLQRTPDAQIHLEIRGEVPPVGADPTYFEQVLQNLLTNAYKYSPPGAVIEVIAARDGDDVVISVGDRGSGISDDDRPHIFEPFYRSRRTSDQASGAGIGLAVCKRLVEVQGGQLWADAREGGGTVMRFSLPAAELD